VHLSAGKAYRVRVSEELLSEIEAMLGEGNVKIGAK